MQWEVVVRGGAGMIGFEVYRRRNDIKTVSTVQERYFAKIFIYDTVVKLSGNPELILQKLQEVSDAVSMTMEVIYKDAENQKAIREIEAIQKEIEQEQIEEALRYIDEKKKEEERADIR